MGELSLKPSRLIFCLILAGVFVLTWFGIASASLFLIFDRTAGAPGTVVHVRTGGSGACIVCPHRMPLYFAQAATSAEIKSRADPRLVSVGSLVVNDQGDGSGALTVPDVPNGRYAVMTYCKPCASESAGRAILPVGPFPPFRVVGSSVAPPTAVWRWVIGALLGVVFATTAGIWLLRRRSSSSSLVLLLAMLRPAHLRRVADRLRGGPSASGGARRDVAGG